MCDAPESTSRLCHQARSASALRRARASPRYDAAWSDASRGLRRLGRQVGPVDFGRLRIAAAAAVSAPRATSFEEHPRQASRQGNSFAYLEPAGTRRESDRPEDLDGDGSEIRLKVADLSPQPYRAGLAGMESMRHRYRSVVRNA